MRALKSHALVLGENYWNGSLRGSPPSRCRHVTSVALACISACKSLTVRNKATKNSTRQQSKESIS
jgi:hypothetical protein